MIRFVDLRWQGVGERFAFWNTIYSTFVASRYRTAWTEWREVEEELDYPDKERLRSLCPPWALESMVNADEAFGFEEDRRGF